MVDMDVAIEALKALKVEASAAAHWLQQGGLATCLLLLQQRLRVRSKWLKGVNSLFKFVISFTKQQS
jgi:hypothetical protein